MIVTENQQWFCDICCKNYKLKRKDKHLLTKVHKKNEERLEREGEKIENDSSYLKKRLAQLEKRMDPGFVKKINSLFESS